MNAENTMVGFTKEDLIDVIRKAVGFNSMQPSSSYAQSGSQVGQFMGRTIAPYVTGNPIMQRLLGDVGGGVAGNVLSGLFPGMSGGLNVNDSLMRQQMQRAKERTEYKVRQAANAGIEDASMGHNKFMFNIASNLAGVGKLGNTLDPFQMGYQSLPWGNKSKFISKGQIEKNAEINNIMFGNEKNKGFVETITSVYGKDPLSFQGAQGKDIGTTANDMFARGLLRDIGEGPDRDFGGSISKIKKAAASLKSIGDIIRGPLKDVVAQMDQTFGSGYLNTFGTGGAAGMVNKMRAVANMGGFSTKQIMALAPATKNMIQAVGGDISSAGNAMSFAGVMNGLARGKDKTFVNDSELTGAILKATVGAQNSNMSQNISSARSLLDEKEKEAFDKKIMEERSREGGYVGLDFIHEASGVSINAIINNKGSSLMKKDMADSNIGLTTAYMAEAKDEERRRKRQMIAVLGVSGYKRMIAANGGDEHTILMNSGKIHELEGVSREQATTIVRNFDKRASIRGQGNAVGAERVYAGVAEGIARDSYAKKMGELYGTTNYGSSLAVNMLSALQTDDKEGTGSERALEAVKKMLNLRNDKRFVDAFGKIDGSKSLAFMKQLKKDAEELGYNKQETIEYMSKHIQGSLTYGSTTVKRDGKDVRLTGTDSYKEGVYNEQLEKKKRNIGRVFGTEEYAAAEREALALKKGEDPLNSVEKARRLGELARKTHLAELGEQIKGATGERKTRLEGVMNRLKKVGVDDYSEALLREKDQLKDSFDRRSVDRTSTEVDPMTTLIELLINGLSAILTAMHDLGVAIAGLKNNKFVSTVSKLIEQIKKFT